MPNRRQPAAILVLFFTLCLPAFSQSTAAEPLLAGVARIEITKPDITRVNDPCYAKALVLKQGDTTAVLVTVDAVAIGGIGAIPDSFMQTVRDELRQDPGISPENLVVNASHCHGVVRSDSDQLVVKIVREAARQMEPVRVSVGTAHEPRISENRRVYLKDGSQVDMRRAYSFAWDEDIAKVGPIDPEVGLLRLDREDGRPLAVVYNFACHPIMNPPSKGSSADFPGYASTLVETAFDGDAMAFFIQGCGGDINPVRYKEVHQPPDAETLGYFLGTRVLDAAQELPRSDSQSLEIDHQILTIPRATDYQQRIDAIEAERDKLVSSLRRTNINFKTFMPLLIQQKMNPEFPSAYAQGYLHDEQIERDDLKRLDAENRAQVEAYLANIKVMEELTRLNANLALLKRHQKETEEADSSTLSVEMCALRVGDFKLVTFPGELTVEVGLNIKKQIDDPGAFVAGYTNGYIYYTPTVAQRTNIGYAQEDCDTLVAPEWQELFETSAVRMLRDLAESKE